MVAVAGVAGVGVALPDAHARLPHRRARQQTRDRCVPPSTPPRTTRPQWPTKCHSLASALRTPASTRQRTRRLRFMRFTSPPHMARLAMMPISGQTTRTKFRRKRPRPSTSPHGDARQRTPRSPEAATAERLTRRRMAKRAKRANGARKQASSWRRLPPQPAAPSRKEAEAPESTGRLLRMLRAMPPPRRRVSSTAVASAKMASKRQRRHRFQSTPRRLTTRTPLST
mmetsp:Transcript_27454/g.72126  ORF Transcript_27454/g.72126 Transcript_27454/m.72126 type:complete len:227 (+) Transcript_27454:1266-1946(+)